MAKWKIVILLALIQFVMILDSTVMNVSISQIVADLNTSVAGIQAAIAFYTLTMAAFMLMGAKLGDSYGRRRILAIGVVIYGIGSFMTGISQNIAQLLFGWSLIEGLGAILVIPAILALAAVNYKDRDRVIAYSIIGGISGAAAAAGPLIGGFVTTYASWRYVFLSESLIMALVLLFFGIIKDSGERSREKLDKLSVVYSALGMFLLTFGVLQSKTWGWIKPLSAPTINGEPITPLGFSLVIYLILAGFGVLHFFYRRQEMLEKSGRQLFSVSLLKIPQLRSGLMNQLIQYFLTAALFFIIPIYLQMSLGFNAFETGIRILPLSFFIIFASFLGVKLIARFSPKIIIMAGKTLIFIAALILVAAIKPELTGLTFGFGVSLFGTGIGLMASQIGNVNMSAVGEKSSSEVGGAQGTSQNFGQSVGVALIGSILIASLTTGVMDQVRAGPNISEPAKSQIEEETKAGVEIVSGEQVYDYMISRDRSKSQAQKAEHSYESAQLEALKESLFFIAIFSALSLFSSRGLPNQPMENLKPE